MSFCQTPSPAGSVSHVARFGEEQAVALADAYALQGHDRLGEHRAQPGEQFADALSVADRDDHERHARVGAEERRAPTHPVGGAVDAEEHGRSGDAAPVQEVDDRLIGRPAVDALVAAEACR
jgi:hypothetical protein